MLLTFNAQTFCRICLFVQVSISNSNISNINDRGNQKINQLLNQEDGCTIEDLLLEEEKLVVLCRGGSIPKLIEFVCQRSTLQKLIGYSVQHPKNQNNHDQTHK